MFLEACVILYTKGEADPLEGTWDQTGSDITHPSRKEHEVRQEVTSYTPPQYGHLMMTTAAVGTHPTGMHYCFPYI